jgi:putative addiction module component (TIGR02574 family)
MEVNMKNTNDLFAEVISLPLDIRTQLVDKLLRSLHPIQKEIDELWAIEAEKRVQEIRTGKITPIPGEDVFRKIGERLGS